MDERSQRLRCGTYIATMPAHVGQSDTGDHVAIAHGHVMKVAAPIISARWLGCGAGSA